MVWAFSCEVIEVDGHKYIKTSERAYHPREEVKDPADVVAALQGDPSSSAHCRLLGNNSAEVRRLWVERDKSLDKSE